MPTSKINLLYLVRIYICLVKKCVPVFNFENLVLSSLMFSLNLLFKSVCSGFFLDGIFLDGCKPL